MKEAFNVEGVDAELEGAALPQKQELSAPLRIAAWTIFVYLLLWSSAFPIIFAFIWHQLGGTFSELGLQFLFPAGFFEFTIGPDGRVDLMGKDYLTMTLPFFVLAIIWEWIMIFGVVSPDKRPRHVPRVADSISSLSLGILNVLIAKCLLLHWGKLLYSYAYENWRITDSFTELDSALNFWVAFILYDIAYYLKHRYSHWFSWLWVNHSAHHSSEEFNLTTALRQPATGFLTPETLFSFAFLAFLFPPQMAGAVGAINLIYQFWIHTQLVPPLGPFEYIFQTPCLHRIHHVRNPVLFGKNYGAVFAIWDILGGTHEVEDSTNFARNQEFEYGIVPVVNSWNPVWTNLHHIHHMIFVQSKWHGWLTPFMHWTPPNGKCPQLGHRLNPWTKYDKKPQDPVAQAYASMQFAVFLSITAYLMLFTPSSEWFQDNLSLGREFAETVLWGTIWLLVLATLCSVATINSADTPVLLRRALMWNMGLHGFFLAGAFAVGYLWPETVNIVGPAAAVWLVLHGTWIARIWPRSVKDDSSVTAS